MTVSVLITTSEELARKVASIIEESVNKSPREKIIRESLQRNGAILIAENIDQAFEFANEYAPEHLEVMISNISLPEIISKIKSAGSVFIGSNTTVPLGDYVIGTNHVLPTNQAAKTRGGLSVLDYIKIIDFQIVSEKGIQILGPYGIRLAEAEGLIEHSNAIKKRIEKLIK